MGCTKQQDDTGAGWVGLHCFTSSAVEKGKWVMCWVLCSTVPETEMEQ